MAQTLHSLGQDYDEDARRHVSKGRAYLDEAASAFVHCAVQYLGACLERDFGIRAPKLVANLINDAVELRSKLTERQVRYLCWEKNRSNSPLHPDPAIGVCVCGVYGASISSIIPPVYHGGTVNGLGSIFSAWKKLLYTRRQTMDTLGIGNTKFYELVARGLLRARKLGKRIMIEGESLHDYVRSLPRAKIKPPNPRATSETTSDSLID